jgi:hypothetical protein
MTESEDSIFQFDEIQLNSKLDIKRTFFKSPSIYDNLFYAGMFDICVNVEFKINDIKCIHICPSCYQSWFNISLDKFLKFNLDNLIQKKYVNYQQVEEFDLAELEYDGLNDKYTCRSYLGSIYYNFIRCKKCGVSLLVLAGFSEKQPALYYGQLIGIWEVNVQKKDIFQRLGFKS